MSFRPITILSLVILMAGAASAFGAEPDPAPPPETLGLELMDISPIPKDYHPIQKPKVEQQYFPDLVEQSVAQAIIAGYKGQYGAIEKYYRFLIRKDMELIRAGKAPTGLADNMLQFKNSHISDPKKYREAQERALEQKDLSDELRKVISYRLRDSELAKAERLVEEDQIDKVGMVINGFLRSLDLVGLTMGSVVGSTVDAAVHTFVNLEEIRKMSVKEKKALAEYQAYLRKYPQAPDVEEVRAEVERLEAKKKHWEFLEALAEAEEYLKDHDHDEAQASYSRALELEPGSTEAIEGLKKVDELRATYEQAMDRSLAVARKKKDHDDRVEEASYRWLLAAVAVGDHEAVQRRAKEFAHRFPKSPLRDEALYAMASSLAASGDYEEAKQVLEEIVDDYGSENMGRRAKFVLSSQEFDRLGEFYQARREHTQKQVKYALLGEDFTRQNVDMGVSQLLVEGIKSVETLGMVNLLGASVRTVQMVSHDPITNEPIIEEGLKFTRDHPESPEVKEVYYQIAKAYEREGRFIDALTYYSLSGHASKRKIASLREKAARSLLAQATMASNSSLQARMYRAILEHFPETDAVPKARERLVAISQEYLERFRLSRDYLLQHPELIGPNGLNLDPRLFDEDLTNREIHEKGIVLMRHHRLKMFFAMPDGSEAAQVYRLHPEVVARLESELREVGRKRAYELSEKYNLEGPVLAAREAFAGTVAEERRYNPFIMKEINELSGNVYLSDEELGQYEETVYADLGADISSDFGDVSTGGALYLRRYGAGVQLGLDRESPNVGALVPLGPLNINTKLRATGISVYPSISLDKKPVPDAELYK